MKEIIKISAKLFLKIIVVNVMCAIIVLSFSVLANGLLSDEVGYTAIGTVEGKEEAETLYNYRFEDGEDTKRAEFEAKGYKITEYPIKELSDTSRNVTNVVSQLFCLIFLASFIYPSIWQLGFKDGNLIKFKHKEADNFVGLKIGLFAIIPPIALLIFMFVAKGITANIPTALYKLANSSLYGFIELADFKALKFGELKIWNFLLMIAVNFIIPIITHIAYILGLKNISISENLIYKKNKKN